MRHARTLVVKITCRPRTSSESRQDFRLWWSKLLTSFATSERQFWIRTRDEFPDRMVRPLSHGFCLTHQIDAELVAKRRQSIAPTVRSWVVIQ